MYQVTRSRWFPTYALTLNGVEVRWGTQSEMNSEKAWLDEDGDEPPRLWT